MPDKQYCMTKEAHMAFKIESSLLDACALAILHRGDTYGYEITQEMKKSITVSESTLYPVLRRLQQEQLCMTYDQPYQGRNRRYYRITEKGEAQLQDYLKQWDDYRNAVQRLLDGPEAGKKDAVKEPAPEEAAKEIVELVSRRHIQFLSILAHSLKALLSLFLLFPPLAPVSYDFLCCISSVSLAAPIL